MRNFVPAPSRLAVTLAFTHLAGILCCHGVSGATTRADTLSVEGVHVVPHQQSPEMRYRQKTDFSLGVRVELFLRNASENTLVVPASVDVRLRGRTPSELLQSDDWAWHDLPPAWGDETLRLPPGALTVWSWNGKRANWGTNTSADLTVELPDSAAPERFEVAIADTSVWLSAVAFLGSATDPFPNSLVFHVANATAEPIRVEACRLWLPTDNQSWRALLETIGDMTRSLRELNRPRPIACWSQGPHHDWNGYGGRKRASPTPDELRLQAYHALSSRITSLYWFNLSLKSLVMFRDLMDEMTRVGREIRMLDQLYLEGAPYRHRRIPNAGKLDWDLASIATPQSALLFALDLAYEPDATENVFRFGPARTARFDFELPSYLREPQGVFRIDADGIQDVTHRSTSQGVAIDDRVSKVGIYVATTDPSLREHLEARRCELIRSEESFDFDPARSDADFEVLRSLGTKP